MMGWLRTLDELGTLIWSENLTATQRESGSRDADRFISSPHAAPGLVSGEYSARQQMGSRIETGASPSWARISEAGSLGSN
jgi:hypothetical protein